VVEAIRAAAADLSKAAGKATGAGAESARRVSDLLIARRNQINFAWPPSKSTARAGDPIALRQWANYLTKVGEGGGVRRLSRRSTAALETRSSPP
jgi:hypothetical protein